MAEEILLALSNVREGHGNVGVVIGYDDDSLSEMDTVRWSQRNDQRKRGYDVLMQAERFWDNMGQFRKDRDRNKRYCYGDQWGDLIRNDCGEVVTEEKYILEQGKVPLKQNLIRRLVRNVMGVYRSQSKEPTCVARDRDEQKLGEMMSTTLQYNMQLNRRSELDARTMEEFLISGMIVYRKWYGWRNDKLDCWTDYVQPNNFFIDTNMRDFRGWDVGCLGEIHDVTFETLCAQFAKNPLDYKRLAEIYNAAGNRRMLTEGFEQFGYSNREHLDFLMAGDPNLCRVLEVWRKEQKPRYRCVDYNNGDVYKIDVEDYDEMVTQVNASRMERGRAAGMEPDDIPLIEAEWFMDDFWYYYYLTPFGDILEEGETPYEHKSHPYAFKCYPFIDGEIHSFVADVIDQQRYTNRLISLYDFIMGASAKGVLLVPEESLPDDMTWDDFSDEWARFNGIIRYKPKPGMPVPQQVSSNSVNIGIGELLNLQLKFFEDISGVNGALQGKPGYSGTSGSLYAQQTQNATTSLLDVLDTFSSFIIDGAYKDVKNIQQFYDQKRTVNIVGKGGTYMEYDPEKIRDVEFDLSIVESTATPAYRQMQNDFLLQIWQAQQISLEQLLRFGDFPFADDLLQNIESQKEQMEQGAVPNGVSPELMARAQEGVDMDAVERTRQMVRGITEGDEE